MDTLPIEIHFEIGTYLNFSELSRWSQTNLYYSDVARSMIERRLSKVMIRVITFIVHYLNRDQPRTEVLAKILVGPVDHRTRNSIINESKIIRKSGPYKFTVIDESHRFIRIEITDTVLGREIKDSDLLSLLSGTQPLILFQPIAFSPLVPLGTSHPLVPGTRSSKGILNLPVYIVDPTVHCRDSLTPPRSERNCVVYHLAHDAHSEFFTTD